MRESEVCQRHPFTRIDSNHGNVDIMDHNIVIIKSNYGFFAANSVAEKYPGNTSNKATNDPICF